MANCYYEFAMPSSVRGYHVYKDIWEVTIGENLLCPRKLNNRHDPFAAAFLGYHIITDAIACEQTLRVNKFCCFARNCENLKIYIPVPTKFSRPTVLASDYVCLEGNVASTDLPNFRG